MRALARRDKIVVATKFFPRSKEEIENGISSKQHIHQLLNRSLKNLGMDYIDLYICHMWDYHMSIEEIMETLNKTVKSGKVRAIGMSNCYAWQLAKANLIAEKNGWHKFVFIQGHYNLMFREEEREMKPFCEDSGIAMTPYSPLASERLVRDADFSSKRILEDNIQRSKYDNITMQDSIIIERVRKLAEKKNLTRTQIALGWLLTKVTSLVVGATKISHIEESVKAVGVTFTEQENAYREECYVPHKLVGVIEFNHA